jgi:hypothetical protein
MAKNKKKFEVGSADPKPSKTSILSNGQAYDRARSHQQKSLAGFLLAPRGAWLRQKSCQEISFSRSGGIKEVSFV